jgi:hypothetical protein
MSRARANQMRMELTSSPIAVWNIEVVTNERDVLLVVQGLLCSAGQFIYICSALRWRNSMRSERQNRENLPRSFVCKTSSRWADEDGSTRVVWSLDALKRSLKSGQF